MTQPIEQGKYLRRRINVKNSTRGQRTWDITVDGVGYTREEMLAESDATVRAMETRYPAVDAAS